MSRLLKSSVLALACLLVSACDRQSSDSAQPAPSQPAVPAKVPEKLSGMIDRSHKGSLLPEFTVSDAAGRKLRLADLKGKPLLINLWATWCAPCVVEMPLLDQLAQQRGADLKVVTISQDMQQTEKVAALMKQRGFDRLEPWLDPENDLVFHYNAGTLPATIYYGADGREIWRYVGGLDWTGPEAATMLAEAR